MLAIFASFSFAIDFSVGGGLDYNYSWNSAGRKLDNDNKSKAIIGYNLIGVSAFFDAEYVRVKLGANFLVGNIDNTTYTVALGAKSKVSESIKKMSGTNVELGILGKYPFTLGIAKIYPMLGFDFIWNISLKQDGTDLREHMTDDFKNDLNHYFFTFGAGSDIYLTENIFLTPTVLFSVDMKKPSHYKDAKKAAEVLGATYADNFFNFSLGLGVGYKF